MKGTITGFQNECSFLLEILCLFVLTCVAKETEVTNNAVLFYSVVATKQKKKKEKEDAIKIEDVTPTDTDTTEEKEPSNPAPHQPPPPPPPPPVPGMWSKLNQAPNLLQQNKVFTLKKGSTPTAPFGTPI